MVVLIRVHITWSSSTLLSVEKCEYYPCWLWVEAVDLLKQSPEDSWLLR